MNRCGTNVSPDKTQTIAFMPVVVEHLQRCCDAGKKKDTGTQKGW